MKTLFFIIVLFILPSLSFAQSTGLSIEELKGNAKAYPSAKSFYNLGMGYLQKKDPKSAIEPFQMAIKLDPQDWKSSFRLGQSFIQTNQIEKSIPILEQTLKIKTDYLPAYYKLSEVYRSLKRYDDAIALLEKVNTIKPNNSLTLYNLGLSYFEKGELDKSLELQKKAFQFATTPGEKHFSTYEVASIYFVKEDFKTAAKTYDLSLQFLNNAPKSLNGLGWSFLKLKHYKQALMVFDRYKDVFPEDRHALYGYGLSLIHLKKTDKLPEIVSKLTKIDPEMAKKLNKKSIQ